MEVLEEALEEGFVEGVEEVLVEVPVVVDVGRGEVAGNTHGGIIKIFTVQVTDDQH